MSRNRKKYNIEIGDKFFNWTVIKFLGVPDKRRGQKVIVECDCENKTRREKEIYVLINELSQSCGCKKFPSAFKGKFSTELTIKYPEYGSGRAKDRSFAGSILKGIKSSASSRNLIFELNELEAFEKYCLGSCFYCGFTPNWPETHNSIDRFDNNKGYIEGNCVPCCFQCNIAKNNKTFDVFKEQVTKIYYYSILGIQKIWFEDIQKTICKEWKSIGRVRKDRKGYKITDLGRKYPLNYGLGQISYAQKVWTVLRLSSKKVCERKDLEFKLNDIEGFEKFIIGTCTYCGLKPQFPYTRNGIDRIDSNKGYTEDNCVACCIFCNKIKCDQSVDEFQNLIFRINNNLELNKLKQ